MQIERVLQEAARGLKLFPVIPGTKRPAIRGWPDAATNEPDGLARLFSKRFAGHDAGVDSQGLLILDVDGPGGEDGLKRKEDDLGVALLSNPVRVLSGSRSPSKYHLYFTLPPGERPARTQYNGNWVKEVDVKCGGRSFVCCPGSTHKSGGQYEWSGDPPRLIAEAPECPPELLRDLGTAEPPDRLSRANERARKLAKALGIQDEELEGLRARFPITGHGQRYHQTLRLVGHMVGAGLGPADVEHVGTKWLDSFEGVYESDRETAVKHLLQVVDSTFKRLLAGTFTLPPTPADYLQQARGRNLLPKLASLYRSVASPTTPPAGEAGEHIHVCVLPLREAISKGGPRQELFLLSLLLLYQQDFLQRKETGKLWVTMRQVLALMEMLGDKPSIKSFERVKAPLVTTLKKGKATAVELIAMESEGTTGGRPSVFRVTGLPLLDESDVGRT